MYTYTDIYLFIILASHAPREQNTRKFFFQWGRGSMVKIALLLISQKLLNSWRYKLPEVEIY